MSRRVCALLIAIALAGAAAAEPVAAPSPAAPAPAAATAAAAPTVAPPPALPAGPALLTGVRARLPEKPLRISGRLVTTAAATGAQSTLGAEVCLWLNHTPPVARYTVSDAFGHARESITVTRALGTAPQFRYAIGADLKPAPTPNLVQLIPNTALSWVDLTLDFLWWPDAKTIGTQEVKGQPCYVVDARSPAQSALYYAWVRLWIDTRMSVLLQADGYDSRGELARRLAVKSFKKIDDQWMIKDLEVQDFPSDTKTVLRVQDVEPIASP